ncbi:MAG: non-homologous end-joining DNA ligase [Actinobacteria bacterium]|nr:non-homologous end-joining DNA ligase [Actinomycetota bacterium]
MLATKGEPDEVRSGFAYEFKWDGVRALAATDGSSLVLRSRTGNDITAGYPELAGLGGAVGRPALLDGEIVAFDEHGRPSFSRLQRRMNLRDARRVPAVAAQVPVAFLVFDVLVLDGPVVDLPYEERRGLLLDLGIAGPHWQVPPSADGDLDRVLGIVRELGLEGVVAKRHGSTYQPGRRSPDWRKIRLMTRQELVVGGYRTGQGSRGGGFGSLLVGHHDEEGLRYAGSVGSGFTDAEYRRVQALLDERVRDTSPFVDRVPHRDVVWCEPDLVVEVQFAEWTPDGILRAPSYKGQRDDKPAGEVVRET